MILADKFTCDIPDFGNTIVSCELPGTGAIEWITGIGTLAAVGVSIFAAAYAMTRDRRAHKDLILEVESQSVLEALGRIDLSDVDQTFSAIRDLQRAKMSFHIRAGSLGRSEAKFADSLAELLDAYAELLHDLFYKYDGDDPKFHAVSMSGGGVVRIKRKIDRIIRHSLLSVRVASRRNEREAEMASFNDSVSIILKEMEGDDLGLPSL